MKLKSIASAIAVIGMGLSCAAWSQIVDPAAGVVITPADNTTTPPTPYSVTATKLADVAGTALSTTRKDTISAASNVTDTLGNVVGTKVTQTTNTLTGRVLPLGSAGTAGSSVQSLYGGAGGVSYAQTDVSKFTLTTTTYSAAYTPTAAIAYEAGSTIGGVVQTAAGTATSVAAGDILITKSATTTSTVGGGLKGTDHDFTKAGMANASIGLCTYCHTPHKASSTLLLWNKTMSTNTFKWDVAATTAGTALPGFNGTSYSGPSAKCLACHDGTVAIGDIGWFAGGSRTGSAALLAEDMKGADPRFVMGNDGKLGADSARGWNTVSTNTTKVAAANAAGTAVHPVAIPYPLNGAPNVYNGSTTGARLATNDFVADPTANNIRLYADVGGGSIVGKVIPGQTGIECSSCHDVHNKAATDKYFLRGKMVGSTVADGYICAQCHTK